MRKVNDSAENRIQVSSVSDSTLANFCESVESGHSSHSESGQIASLLGITKGAVRMDSQCKYGAIARGDASIYLRLTKVTYKECIWDHAAGFLIVKEAGGEVTDLRGKPLDWSKGAKLFDNHGVIATNGLLHEKVLMAVEDVLFPPTHKFRVQITSKSLSLPGSSSSGSLPGSSNSATNLKDVGTKAVSPETIQQILSSGLGIDPSLIIVETSHS